MLAEALGWLVVGAGGYALGRYRAHQLQHTGESKVSLALMRHFPPPAYHLLNSVTLQVDDGTTQIDHVLVSRFGVFVIETKQYKGWIYGTASQPSWTQVLYKHKYRFQNPIHQNYKHLKAVQALLDFLPAEHVRGAVVFVGDAEFKTPRPEGVFSLRGLTDHLTAFAEEVISENRVHFCVGRLECARLALSRMTDVQHRAHLNRRFGVAD